MEPIPVLNRAVFLKGKPGLFRCFFADILLLLQALTVFFVEKFFNYFKPAIPNGLSYSFQISIIKDREVDSWPCSLTCVSRYSGCYFHALPGRHAEVNGETSQQYRLYNL
jgi:hypothetical protein